MKSILFRVLFSGLVLLLMAACSSNQSRIEKCVEAELALHPEAHLVDLYKYFFQDVFGPGHLVTNKEGAEKYLNQELSGAKAFEPFDFQELMYTGQFIRANLRLISNGEISQPEFLDFFMQSAEEFKIPEVDDWRREWTEIVKVIKELKPDLPGYSDESLMIDSILQSGNYAVHHSREYIRAYDPHYRILQRKFLKKLNYEQLK